jgi:CPA1 family monovalent cation:H+ antiporter
MLLAVLASGYLVRALPVALPLPIVQIALGGVIAGVFHHGVALQPEVFFLLFLPPLLFLDGWRIPKDGLMRDRRAILQLAFGLVIFTVVGAGYLIHWLIPAVPLAVAFALAAIISPTDPVAVSSIAGSTPIPRRLMHVLEGESLLNDASGLVCFQFAVVAALTGSFSLNQAAVTFAWLVAIGLLSGVAFTLGVALVQQWLTRRFGAEGGSPILVNLLTPFGAYLLAEQLGASGILAAVAAGVTMSYVELSGRSMAETRIERNAVWDTIQFTLNGIMFVLLGEQLPSILRDAVAAVGESGHFNSWWLLLYAVVIACGLAALRCVWVWISLRVYLWHHRADPKLPRSGSWRVVAVTSLAGVRGAVTLAGVLTLPLLMPDGSHFPARGLVIFLAAAVILLSLAAGSVGLPRLLRGMAQQLEPAAELEADRAQTAAAEAAIQSVQRESDTIRRVGSHLDADVCAAAENRVIAAYQDRLNAHGKDVDETGAARLRQADLVERKLRLAGFQAEREAILRLARARQISDETSRRMVRRIDLLETLYR